jgi:hypothetical protein
MPLDKFVLAFLKVMNFHIKEMNFITGLHFPHLLDKQLPSVDDFWGALFSKEVRGGWG